MAKPDRPPDFILNLDGLTPEEEQRAIDEFVRHLRGTADKTNEPADESPDDIATEA